MSDISLSFKLLNSLYKFYAEKQGEMPIFFGNDVSEYIPASIKEDMPISKGDIDTTRLRDLSENLFQDSDISLSCLGMLHNGKVVKEYYAKPYSKEYRHVSYSVCKTVVALAVGIAIDKELISLDTKLYQIFPEHNKIFMKRNMKLLTIKHLLTMTAGVYFDEVSAFFSYDWRRDFMGSEVLFPPGKEFYYNSLNSYMLGACVSKVSGKNLMEFLQENLFDPMNITDITWDKCPMGLCRGGWGMKLSLRDMLKIGQLIANKGAWKVKGKKVHLVSKAYMEEMLAPQVEIKDKRLISGYGYGIWLLKDGAYLLNGIFGQNVYVNTQRKVVIATLGSAHELFPDGKLIDKISNFVVLDDNFTSHRFRRKLPDCFKSALKLNKPKRLTLGVIKKNLSIYLGNEYRFKDYASSILPLFHQVMYSNFLSGIDSISFDISGEDFYFKIKDSDIDIKLKMGYSDTNPYEYQIININGKEIPLAVSAKLFYDEDSNMLLRIHVVFLEEVFDKVFKIYFKEDFIKFKSYETPDLMRFLSKFIDDDRLIRIRKFKDLTTPDYISYKAKKILRPQVIGYIDD